MYNFTGLAQGEPVDLAMLSQMAQYIADLNQQVLEQKSASSSLQSAVRLHIDTADVTIWTGKVLIASDSTPNAEAGNHVNWSAPFDITFTSVPIVTATVYCDTTGGGTIAPSAVWLHEITPTGVKGKFKWLGTTTKQETVYAQVIAIGQGVVS